MYVVEVTIIHGEDVMKVSANHHPLEDLAKSRYEYHHPFCIFG
jgi:hypothetical protein